MIARFAPALWLAPASAAGAGPLAAVTAGGESGVEAPFAFGGGVWRVPKVARLPVACLLALLAAGSRSAMATARRLAPRTGWPVAVPTGYAYVVARAYVILLAVAQVKLFPRPLPKDPLPPLDETLS